MNKLCGMLLAALLLAAADAWSYCEPKNTVVTGNDYACDNGKVRSNYVESVARQCAVQIANHVNCSADGFVNIKCPVCYGTSLSNAYHESICCSSKSEADSLSCLLQGNVWQGGTCKINHCKAADSTWLSTSIAACTGSNNYAIVNTDSTCEHVGTCCPNDSIPSGNTCKWRCDSVLTACNGRTGDLFGAVLPDTSVSGQDTTFSYQCFYNCAYSPNPDSTVYLVEGNTVLSGPNDSIADGIKSEWFSSIRSTTGSIYVYDYLSPSASEYVDSIAAMKCVEHLWRCVINKKYVYWYDNQEVPAGCTNIVRVK
jgi:hypothetical protein